MSERPMYVKLKFDTSRFVAALAGLGRQTDYFSRAMQRFTDAFQTAERRHRDRHHKRETPALSALHTHYDRRRRARRKRR